MYTTHIKRHGRAQKVYIFLLRITSRVNKVKPVCMNTYILAIIIARDTKFGI